MRTHLLKCLTMMRKFTALIRTREDAHIRRQIMKTVGAKTALAKKMRGCPAASGMRKSFTCISQ